MMNQIREESFGGSIGANAYIELILANPELRDARVIDIANKAAMLAIDAHKPYADHMVPAKVTKAIVREIEDMTFEKGRYAPR